MRPIDLAIWSAQLLQAWKVTAGGLFEDHGSDGIGGDLRHSERHQVVLLIGGDLDVFFLLREIGDCACLSSLVIQIIVGLRHLHPGRLGSATCSPARVSALLQADDDVGTASWLTAANRRI